MVLVGDRSPPLLQQLYALLKRSQHNKSSVNRKGLQLHRRGADERSSTTVEEDYLAGLPVEILLLVLRFLSPFELCHCMGMVNKRFNELSCSNTLWRPLFSKRWECRAKDMARITQKEDWRDVYRWRCKTEADWTTGVCTLRTFTGHGAGVWSLKLRDNVVVSGGADCAVKMWHLNRRYRNVQTLRGHAGIVKCIDYDADHNKIASGSCDGIIRIWDTRKMKSKKSATMLEGHSNWVRGLQMCGNVLVSASSDHTLRVWNVEEGRCVGTFDGHTNYVRCLQFQGHKLVSGAADNTIRVWDMNTLQCLQVMSGHNSVVRALQFDGNRLVTASADCTLGVWDLSTEKSVASLCGHTLPLWCMSFEGDRLVSGSGDRTIKIWDLRKFACTNTLVGHTLPVWSVAVEGSTVVSGSADRLVKVWNFG